MELEMRLILYISFKVHSCGLTTIPFPAKSAYFTINLQVHQYD